jgi:hypothetical protein
VSTEPEKSTERLPAEPETVVQETVVQEPVVQEPAAPEAVSSAEPPPAAPPPPPPPPAATYQAPPPGQPRWQRVSRRSWLGLTIAALLVVGCLCGVAGVAIGVFAGHRIGDDRRHGPVVNHRPDRDDRPFRNGPNGQNGPGFPGGPNRQRNVPPTPSAPTPSAPTPATPSPSASTTA